MIIDNNKQIYIVTGAAGHLGSVVTRMLNDAGCIIYAFCLPNEKHLPQGKNINIIFGNVCNYESLVNLFKICKINNINKLPITLIHCAGIVSISSNFNKNVYNVNVNGVKNILSLCETYKINKLIYISSVHVIPELPAGNIITEVDHFSPDDVIGLYAKTKAQASQYVIEYIKRGFYANIIHPSGIIGPGDFGNGHITQLIIDFCKGGLTSGLNGGYDFVDVRDVADGILSCCKNGENGECYILSGQYLKVYELLNLLHEITGRKAIKRILPLWFAKLTAPLSELYYKILNQPPLFTAYSIYTLSVNANFSNEKAKKHLGYTTRPIKQTLADTIKWLEENNRLKK